MKSFFLSLIFAACLPCLAAGAPFINLDFNSGLPVDPVPGWTSDNSYVFTSNYVCLGASCVIRMGVPGDYRLFLQSGVAEILNYEPVGAAISQTGDIPVDARSIRMESRLPESYETSYENLLLTIDGQNVPLVVLSIDDRIVTLGGDIREFAGDTVELTLSTKPLQTQPDFQEFFAWLDNVSFLTNTVPEPSTLLPLAVAGLGMIGRREFCLCRR